MKKKELRKELELSLLKSIEETLKKHHSETTKGIRKIVFETAKTIAKKYYKTIKRIPEKVIPLAEAPPLLSKGKAKRIVKSPISEKPKINRTVKTPVTKKTNRK